MDTEPLIRRRRRPELSETAGELDGVLSVPKRPIITTSNTEVYRGVWGGPHGERVDVAVKQLKPLSQDTHSDPQALRKRIDTRIRREVTIWNQAIHPNLHPFVGYRLGRQPRLISPWCRHGNLTDYLRANPGLSRVDKLRLIYQAASGLNHLHSLTPPICHADIKPENVLINDSCEAALSDFGLSRILQEHGEPSGLTTSETPRGTSRYMAPELLGEERPRPSHERDVYAFGGLILAVMSGKPPFAHLREATIILRIVQGQIPKADEHPGLPPDDDLWNLIRRCWSTDPTARPTMRVVLLELWGHISREQSCQDSTPQLLATAEAGLGEHSNTNVDATAGQEGTSNSVRGPADDSPSVITNIDDARNTIAGVLPVTRRRLGSSAVRLKAIPVNGRHVKAATEDGSTVSGMAHVGSMRVFFF